MFHVFFCIWQMCVYRTLRSIYTVFSFISTEQGKVLKVLHTSEGVFIISQYSMFHNEGPVLNMAIDSQKVRGVRIGVVEGDVSRMLQHQ